jgi:DNA-binding response OmpR family regulator
VAECRTIWLGCNDEEQEALMALYTAHDEPEAAALTRLSRRHLVKQVEGQSQPFSRLFAEFVRRRAMERFSSPTLSVDADAGDVLVNGVPVEPLSNLEFKLILLLYENCDHVVDKYQIVTAVWGEEYLDEVDDARIEKLVSRLRQKIEPDAGNPIFVTTLRGRGYRLVNGDQALEGNE